MTRRSSTRCDPTRPAGVARVQLVCSGYLRVTLLLLSYGSSLSTVDENGQTAADLARTLAVDLCAPMHRPPACAAASLSQHVRRRFRRPSCITRPDAPVLACSLSRACGPGGLTSCMQRAADRRVAAVEARLQRD
jgi:hypothetical protein